MNPIAISIGPLEIRWYAILILSAFLLGIYLIRKESATSYYTRIYRNTTSGGIDNDRSHQTQKARPVITVNSTVYSTGGDGTITNPYILS